MPLVKVELKKGREKAEVLKIRDAIMDSVVEGLKLPNDDRNIRVTEYEGEFFTLNNPYEVLIEITMFSGRSLETKKILFEKIVNVLEEKSLLKKNQIFIILNEQPKVNWGIRGGIPASEIELGFKVEI